MQISRPQTASTLKNPPQPIVSKITAPHISVPQPDARQTPVSQPDTRQTPVPQPDACQSPAAPKEPRNPVKAIRAKCLDCCCGQVKEITLCASTYCPLPAVPFSVRQESVQDQAGIH